MLGLSVDSKFSHLAWSKTPRKCVRPSVHSDWMRMHARLLHGSGGSIPFIRPRHPPNNIRAGGLGGLDFPLLSDITRRITTDYGVLIPEEGVALRSVWMDGWMDG